jgi:hypothetical protein
VTVVASTPESLPDGAEVEPESLPDEAEASGTADGAEVEPEHATPSRAPSSIAAIEGRLRATDIGLILIEEYTKAIDGCWRAKAASGPL